MFSSFLAVIVAAASARAAIGPITDLAIVNGYIAPDGFNRSATLPGGTYPGPLITAKKGDQFKINVQDRLTDKSMFQSTTVHWHGFIQKNTNWADGTAFVSQCPIVPGHDFKYIFETGDQAGTFWYHSHLSTQYCDGLAGPMVVYDPEDPLRYLYDVDDESTVITLSDWYHTPSPAQSIPATSNSTLVNGKGRYVGGPAVPLSVVQVEQGVRYRFRLVSLACDPDFTFSIEGHEFTVIAVDGVNVAPRRVNEVQIFIGQRYDVVLEASKKIDNYHIRVQPNRGSTGFKGGINSAVLRYKGAPNSEPKFEDSKPDDRVPVVEKDLVPLDFATNRVPGEPHVNGADVNINLNMQYDKTKGAFTINGKSFVPPPTPVLLQILSGKYKPQDLLPEGLVIPLPRNKSVQLSFPALNIGELGGSHPFHMHGHEFHVVRSAGQQDYNFIDPPRRDTVQQGFKNDNVTIRFRTDNPGPWFFHCHINWHIKVGLAVVFAEAPEEVPKTVKPPPAWDELCPLYKGSALNETVP